MSSKKAMKKIQKLAFQKHKNNIRNNKFRPKINKFLINIKNEKVSSDLGSGFVVISIIGASLNVF